MFRRTGRLLKQKERYSFLAVVTTRFKFPGMIKPNEGPRDPKKSETDATYLPDMTPRREGGDDSLAEASPYDSRDDEKVIVNTQRENKTVNRPSQTAANTSENAANDEEVL
jgi:hypothetical protein